MYQNIYRSAFTPAPRLERIDPSWYENVDENQVPIRLDIGADAQWYEYNHNLGRHDPVHEEVLDCSAREALWLMNKEPLSPYDHYKTEWPGTPSSVHVGFLLGAYDTKPRPHGHHGYNRDRRDTDSASRQTMRGTTGSVIFLSWATGLIEVTKLCGTCAPTKMSIGTSIGSCL